jgi:hypothetical protein
MRTGVLQRPYDRGPEDVSRHSYDEELAESSIKHQFWRHTAVTASENCGVRALAFGQFCQDFLLHCWEARAPTDEARVSSLQAIQCIFRAAGRLVDECHDGRSPEWLLMPQ